VVLRRRGAAAAASLQCRVRPTSRWLGDVVNDVDDPLGHGDDGLRQQLELGFTDVERLTEEDAEVDGVERQPTEREHDHNHYQHLHHTDTDRQTDRQTQRLTDINQP